MIVGERPFQAEDTLQLLGMHRAAPIPRLADRVKTGIELPHGLQELIDKAMAKSPDARFQTAIEFAEAIDEVLARQARTDDRRHAAEVGRSRKTIGMRAPRRRCASMTRDVDCNDAIAAARRVDRSARTR